MDIEDTPAVTRIRKDITTHPVVLYMEGTPMFPMNIRAATVAQALDLMGVAYKAVNLIDDPEIKDSITAFGNCPSLPQLYINGHFAGGGDTIHDLAKNEGLREILSAAGIATHSTPG
ncbi:MAG: monothiol glutaredoxin, Grx4 family [Rhodospirillaceae bacterium]|nr:monothiol glutaredoxin, Grx4 family [Rhodospirillaceae bacterium]